MQTRLLATIKRKYRRQLLPPYRLYRGLVVCPPRRIERQKREMISQGNLDPNQRQLLSQVSNRISPRDTMYDGDGWHYFSVGLSAVECIEKAMAAAKLSEVKSVLDLPCGHGRVLRALKPKFPEAVFTACEIDRDGVEFCQREFGAEPAYSRADLENLTLERQFDLMWCGSLMTHLMAENIQKLLQFFNRHLAPNGLLVFSAHGELVVNRLRDDNSAKFPLTGEAIAVILESYRETGFAYADYPEAVDGYGLSFTSRPWFESQIGALPGWETVYFAEQGWDSHHDVYGVRRCVD